VDTKEIAMHTQPLCAALLAAWTTVAAQQPVPQPTPPPSTDPVQELRELKASYMACDKAATHRALPFAEAVACSMVSEALLRKAFGGDFHALLAWWRVAKNERERETWSE
jgi:hypothetical protein